MLSDEDGGRSQRPGSQSAAPLLVARPSIPHRTESPWPHPGDRASALTYGERAGIRSSPTQSLAVISLLDLAIGLLEPQSGKVTIDGIAFNELDIESWHAQMAYLGQDAFAFAGTVRDNLVWGGDRQWPDAELLNALHAVKLLGVGVSGTEILNRDAGENGCNLSGGEKQRLALARLFLRQPSLMILDEPSTGLDASTEKDIFQSISSFFRKTTLIMVTHREELTRDADHIVRFVSDGIKVEAGAAVWTAGKP